MLKGISNVLCEDPLSERNEITCCWSILRTFVSVIGPSVETLGLFDENLAVHQTFNIFDLKFTTISASSWNNILHVIYTFLLLINWWACYFYQNHNTTWILAFNDSMWLNRMRVKNILQQLSGNHKQGFCNW